MEDKKAELPNRKKTKLFKNGFNKKKKSGKSLLKRKSKERKNRAKKKKLVIFGTTLFLMIVCLFVYSLSFLLAPSHNLKAKITTVRGGYKLSYEICSVPKSELPNNASIGDTVYIKENGSVSRLPKNAIRMKVVSLDNEMATLSFDISGVPDFISTSDIKNIAKSDSSGKIHSYIYVSGKVIGGRFVLQKLNF